MAKTTGKNSEGKLAAPKKKTNTASKKSAQQEPADDWNTRGEGGIFLGIVQFILVFAFIAGSFTVSAILKAGKKEPPAREVKERILFAQTQNISPAPYSIAFETTGIVATRADITVSPQVSGKVVAVNDAFFEGGEFAANDVLFEIEPLDFELEIRRLESVVAQARTAFNLEEAESAAAVAEWEQIHGDKPAPALVARKPQKAEAWANLKSAKAQLEDAKLDLDRTKFSLPFAGRVLSADLEVGQFVSAGQNYGSVYDANNLEVQVSLEDTELNWLTQGEAQGVEIETTHFGQTQSYEGYLKRGVSSLDNQTRFARVSFGFKEAPEDLLPGVFVTLNIQGPKLENALALPVSALQKDNQIWAVNPDKTLYLLPSEIAFANEQDVVLSGIESEIEVVISKIPGATQGMTVRTSVQDSSNNDEAKE